MTGNHTAKVYVDGSNARLQVLDRLGERDVYVTEEGAWIWDSREQAATHITVDRAALEALEAEADARADEARAQLEAELGAPASHARRGARPRRWRSSTSPPTSPSAPTPAWPVVRSTSSCSSRRTTPRSSARCRSRSTGTRACRSRHPSPQSVPMSRRSASRSPTCRSRHRMPRCSRSPRPRAPEVTEHEVPIPTVAELEQWKAESEAGADTDGKPRPVVHGSGWSTVVELPAGSPAAERAEGAEGATGRRARTARMPPRASATPPRCSTRSRSASTADASSRRRS